MRCLRNVASLLAVAGALSVIPMPLGAWAADPAKSTDATDKVEPAKKAAGADVESSKPELSKEMVALRDRLRQALAAFRPTPLNTRDHTPDDILLGCLAFGADAQVLDVASNQRINAIGMLCWNFPASGAQLLTTNETGVLARVGYGLQSRPGEFLAMLALSRIPPDYEIKVAKFHGTVADLLQPEKLSCLAGTDQSLRLVGLSYYTTDDAGWKNQIGEDWSVARLVEEELARAVDRSDRDATDRLLGLSFAVDRRIKRNQPVDGVFRQAQEHVAEFQQYALGLENPDGSWHPRFFAVRGTSRDSLGTLRSTGHVLEWLVLSLPEDRLEDAAVVRSVNYVAGALGAATNRWGQAWMTPRETDAYAHALHALVLYDLRCFKPRDPAKPPAESKPPAKKVARRS